LKQLQADDVKQITVSELNDMLAGMGVEQFSYDTFVAAHNDPKIKNIIKNFNKDKIFFKQDAVDGIDQAGTGGDAVGQMAKNAVDLSDL
jgi:ribosomal protein L12E/L44/L45/RPP1/RPP2